MSLIETIEEFKLKYDDNKFIKDNKLSSDVLEYYVNNYVVDWDYISAYQTLTESFITKYSDKVDWVYISMYQTLSEQFIIKYMDKMEWWCISIYQTLSESFIEQYSDSVDWWYISKYQTLSDAFIEKYKDKVNWFCIILKNKRITLCYEFIVEHLYDFNLYDMSIDISNDNINRLVKEYPDKYRIDKIAHEFNK